MQAPHGHPLLALCLSLQVVPRTAYRPAHHPTVVAQASSDQPYNNHEPQPRRITSNVKRNLHLLKIFKEYAKKQSNSARPTTSYRRKKIEKEDLPDDIAQYEDPTTKLYFTNDGFELATPVLLVDGYNMCGYWPKLKKHFARGNLEAARDKLIDELITFTHIKGVKVVVVFDAVLSGLPNHKEVMSSVDIVYAASTDSDSWIEREVTLLRADGCPKVWVATSDTFHQHAAHGAVCDLLYLTVRPEGQLLGCMCSLCKSQQSLGLVLLELVSMVLSTDAFEPL